jgi:hypothetical protein
MDPPFLIIDTEHRNNQNNIYRQYIPYIFLYISLFAIAWYGLNKNYIHPDYHFGVKIVLFTLPVIFGLNNLNEIVEEDFSNKTKDKNNFNIKFINKIKYQLIDIQNKDTLALVDEQGNVQFLNDIYKNKKKQSKKSWYQNLKK